MDFSRSHLGAYRSAVRASGAALTCPAIDGLPVPCWTEGQQLPLSLEPPG